MAALTPQVVVGPFPLGGTVAADALDITFAAMALSPGDTIALTGREIVIVRNDDVGAVTLTFTAQPDGSGRTLDITAYSIGAGEYAAFSFMGADVHAGWRDGSGNVTLISSDVDLFIAVLRLSRP